MTDPNIPPEILVIATPAAGPAAVDDDEMNHRRWPGRRPRAPELKPVQITELNTQINIFLSQLDQVMDGTPAKVAGFKMSEFEVTVGIVAGVSGGVSLALLANAEASGEVNAGIKFVFKRSEP